MNTKNLCLTIAAVPLKATCLLRSFRENHFLYRNPLSSPTPKQIVDIGLISDLYRTYIGVISELYRS